MDVELKKILCYVTTASCLSKSMRTGCISHHRQNLIVFWQGSLMFFKKRYLNALTNNSWFWDPWFQYLLVFLIDTDYRNYGSKIFYDRCIYQSLEKDC